MKKYGIYDRTLKDMLREVNALLRECIVKMTDEEIIEEDMHSEYFLLAKIIRQL